MMMRGVACGCRGPSLSLVATCRGKVKAKGVALSREMERYGARMKEWISLKKSRAVSAKLSVRSGH